MRTPEVEAALRAVPRERFVPDLGLRSVYADRAQLVKEDDSTTLSTISQPTMVAVMLEHAEIGPGAHVLEIGCGTGYNAALLGTLVGPTGTVVSIDVEADLVAQAAVVLGQLGLDQVQVHVGDGRDGWPALAPYDCVMSTVGVERVPETWRAQTRDGGRLLVPMLDSQTLEVQRRAGEHFVTVSRSGAAFIPLR